MDLARAVDDRLQALLDSLHKVGTVSGTSGARVVVTVNGGSLTLPRLASYTPTTGDVVQIIAWPGQWLVLGKTA